MLEAPYRKSIRIVHPELRYGRHGSTPAFGGGQDSAKGVYFGGKQARRT
jgi:hypothetical protein